MYLNYTPVDRISDLIEEYIQRPRKFLFEDFQNDKWKIIEILQASDRRIGKKRLIQLYDQTTNEQVKYIIEKRLEHAQRKKKCLNLFYPNI